MAKSNFIQSFLFSMLVILLITTETISQTIVINETFDDCAMPSSWSTEMVEGEHDWRFGMIDNSKTGTTDMDGTCMAYFDDDGIGKEALPSRVSLISPIFDGTIHSQYFLELDLIYRTYTSLEDLSIYLFDGQERHLLQIFVDDVGGPHFDVYERIKIELSKYRSPQMQIIIEYQDAGEWNWWMGVDNFLVYGEGITQDICDRSITLNDFSPCVEGDANYALFSGTPTSCDAVDESSLWFDYTSSFTGILKMQTTSEYNDVITLFSGECGNLTEVTCHDRDEHGFEGEKLYVEVDQGTKYYIRVSGKESKFGKTKGFTCIKVERALAYPTSPINDHIDVFQELFLDTPCANSMTNIDADFDAPIPILNERSRSDIWYVYDAQEDISLNVSSYTDFAEVVTVYTKDGTTYTEIASQDKGEPFDMKVAKDTRYYIQLSGYFATVEGNICIELTTSQTTQVDNTICGDAIVVPVDGTCQTYSNIGASYSGVKPSCDVYPSSDIWFKFEAPSSTKIRIKTEANFIHTLTIYEGDCSDLDEFYCSNTVVACDGFIELINLEEGDEYLVQIASTKTHYDLIEGEVCLTIEDADTPLSSTPLALSVIQECLGNGSGQLLIEATGGSGTYTYAGNTTDDILFNNEPYTVIVLDDLGCERAIYGVMNCEPDNCTLQADITTTDQACFGENDGIAMINISSGLAPYTYSWSDGSSSESAENLAPGNYQVTVVDAMNCPMYFDFEIMATSLLSTDVTAVSESAYNSNDGSAIIIAAGGQGPYNYLWSTGSTENIITDMAPAEYQFTITDANGCQFLGSTIIPSYDCTVTAVATQNNVSCFNGADGSLTLDISLGDGPYDVLWSNNETTETIENLTADNYSVTITDAKGCPLILNLSVDQAPLIETTILAQENVSCNGENDASVSLESMGGTGSLSYEWPDGSTESSKSDLAPGLYEVTVSDENQCAEIIAIDITEPEVLAIAGFSIDNITCNGADDGRVMVMIQGGTENYSYLWDDPLGQTQATAESLAPGEYSVEITDANGCSVIAVFQVQEPELLSATIDQVNPDVNFGSQGSAEITVEGGTGPYTFEWILDNEVISTDEDPTNLLSGIYTLVILDANGCTISINEIIIENVSAVKETKLAESILLQPNPAQGHCTLVFEKGLPQLKQINLLDPNGKRIKQLKIEKEQSLVNLNLDYLPDGIYLIELLTDLKPIYKKLVIQH